jgi:hypothetical protein
MMMMAVMIHFDFSILGKLQQEFEGKTDSNGANACLALMDPRTILGKVPRLAIYITQH